MSDATSIPLSETSPQGTPRDAVKAWSDAKTDAERKEVMAKHPKIKDILSPGHWSHLEN